MSRVGSWGRPPMTVKRWGWWGLETGAALELRGSVERKSTRVKSVAEDAVLGPG